MIEYKLCRSNRKTIAIQVRGQDVTVRAPQYVSEKSVEEFVCLKENWIRRHLEENKASENKKSDGLNPHQKAEMYEKARAVLGRKALDFARQMGVSFGRITIKEQKTRWGSCSSRGNLNFNWKLMLAPEEVQDYVVVHELAHLKEMNHSPAFYGEVEKIMPDYRLWQKWLRYYGKML